MSALSTFTATFLGSLAAHVVWNGSKYALQFISGSTNSDSTSDSDMQTCSIHSYDNMISDFRDSFAKLKTDLRKIEFQNALESCTMDTAGEPLVPLAVEAKPVDVPAPRAASPNPAKADLSVESNFSSDAETKVDPSPLPGLELEQKKEPTKAKKKRNKNKKKSKPSETSKDHKQPISGTDFATLDEVQCP